MWSKPSLIDREATIERWIAAIVVSTGGGGTGGEGGRKQQTDMESRAWRWTDGPWACLLTLVFAPISDKQSRNKKTRA